MQKPQTQQVVQYTPSYAEVGVVAQHGHFIEVRTPDPDVPDGPWSRVWLTRQAAQTLLEWLPRALQEQDGILHRNEVSA